MATSDFNGRSKDGQDLPKETQEQVRCQCGHNRNEHANLQSYVGACWGALHGGICNCRKFIPACEPVASPKEVYGFDSKMCSEAYAASTESAVVKPENPRLLEPCEKIRVGYGFNQEQWEAIDKLLEIQDAKSFEAGQKKLPKKIKLDARKLFLTRGITTVCEAETNRQQSAHLGALQTRIIHLEKQEIFLQKCHDSACLGLTKAVEARREAEAKVEVLDGAYTTALKRLEALSHNALTKEEWSHMVTMGLRLASSCEVCGKIYDKKFKAISGSHGEDK